jgi:ELWxxDGT repeat protein
VLVKDIVPGTGSSNPFNLSVLNNNNILFEAGETLRQLYVSDGTVGGTFLLKDINPGTEFYNFNSITYFFAEGNSGNEVWRTDGTIPGTQLLKDINPGPLGSEPYGLLAAGSILYFTANDGVHGNELWKTNGTSPGTVMVKDINPGSAPGSGISAVMH